jgi:His-Xaa-Ser system protein HxsD
MRQDARDAEIHYVCRQKEAALDPMREVAKTDPTTRTTSMSHREVHLDLRVHPLLAIQKTAAALAHCSVIQIALERPETALVSLTDRDDTTPGTDLVATFMSLLHDLTLQDQIADRTKDIRSALVRAAFAEALTPPK